MNTEKTSFVHLHLNTNYSFYHGLVEARAAARFCREAGMTACACTDHGTLAGSMAFKRAMEAEGVKPIYGCEFLVGDWEENWPSRAPQTHRGMTLVCLAENLEGYRNLCRLATSGGFKWEEAWRGVNSISKDNLRKYHNGLIALSGGPTGEVARKCLTNTRQTVDEAIAVYVEIFGKDNFFLEIQDHGSDDERIINQELLSASKRNGVPLVATNDVHYLTKEQAHAHEILLCMANSTEWTETNHIGLPGEPEYFLKTPAEMERLLVWCPEALQNTVAIAERCNVVIPTTETDSTLCHKPSFQLPEDFKGTPDDYLRNVCKAGLRRRYGIDADASSHTAAEQRVIARMEHELCAIAAAKWTNDLLVIWDLLWDSSKEAWRWYNIGRGAVCGSLIAYLMPLHDVDPLKYNLLFERFLNEERRPWLDFGIDEATFGNDIVYQEAQKRYGIENVARRLGVEPVQSDTIVIRVAQALGSRSKDYERIVDIIKEYWTVKSALKGSKKLQRLVKSKAWAKEIVETSIDLERKILENSGGNSGIIIGNTNLSNVCIVDTVNCGLVSFLDYFEAQELGMLEIGRWRMDRFVEEALRNSSGMFQAIPDNVPEVFAMLAKDDDRFYCESMPDELLTGEVAKALRRFSATEYDPVGHFFPDVRPRNIEELTAFYAICRPGPMGFLDEYLRRRSGEIPIVYETAELETILKETYGIILYQEQFMQVIRTMTGFSLGQGDCIRRSMGTRRTKKIDLWHEKFFNAALERGFSADCVKSIWDKLLFFSMYCYPKAHATARALLLYRIAYVKATGDLERGNGL